MKKTKIIINCLSVFDYLSVILFPMVIIFWILDKLKIISFNFDFYLFIPIFLLLACFLCFLNHRIEKSQWYLEHEKNYYKNYLFNKNPYKSRFNATNNDIFFLEFEKTIDKNTYTKDENELIDRYYLFKLQHKIKGIGFIEFERIKDLSNHELEKFLLNVLKLIIKKEPNLTSFLVCVFCDEIDEETFYFYSKFKGLYSEEIDDVKHEVNFCLLDRNNNNAVFFDYKLYKLDFHNIFLKNTIKKYLLK